MRIRINLRLLYIIIAVVVIAVLAYYLKGYLQVSHPQSTLPAPIMYAVEYFNEQYSNQTLLVPSQYYNETIGLMRNNNVLVENDTEYAKLMFGGAKSNKTEFALTDLGELDNLSYFYNLIREPAPSLTEFSGNYSVENYSGAYQQCLSFISKVDAFYLCGVYYGNTKVGNATLVNFPNNSTVYIANGTYFLLPSSTTTYTQFIPTTVNAANRVHGIVFSYIGLASFYIPPSLLGTIFGRNEFMKSNDTVSNFWGAEIIKVN